MKTVFEIGKKYVMSSPCDQDAKWYYTVIKRTKASITLRAANGDKKTCRVSEFLGEEICKPLGNYSMCPILGAGKRA